MSSSKTLVNKSSKEWKDTMAQYPSYRELTTLKPWHTVVIVRHHMLGEPWTEIGKEIGRNPTSLGQIALSPAGQALTTYLDSQIQDPVKLAKDIAAASSLGVTLDWYMALEWAKDARDYVAVAKMTKDLAALGGIQATPPKQEIETSKTIRIVFDGSTLEQEAVEADWEEITDDDDDEDL